MPLVVSMSSCILLAGLRPAAVKRHPEPCIQRIEITNFLTKVDFWNLSSKYFVHIFLLLGLWKIFLLTFVFSQIFLVSKTYF